jgi:hypothetical protein
MRNAGCGKTERLRGLTIVEVVVVVMALAFLLLGLLIPALARTRCSAFRMTCGTNLSGLGKAMLLYANDYDDELPRAAGRNSRWAPVDWDALTRRQAYAMTSTDGAGGNGTISSCFYLLIKYAEVTPKAVLCTNDPGVTEFSLTREARDKMVTELTQAWDFGANPAAHCSYTYHAPWGVYALTTAGDPNIAVAADRNPWLSAPKLKAKPFPTSPDGKHRFQGKIGDANDQKYGNASVHKEDGQNVMYLDTHVTFEKRAYCGVDDDNIYTISTSPDQGDPLGVAPAYSPHLTPGNRRDSVLVHDPPTWPVSTDRK